jgi:hypothetical protein
MKSTSSQRQRRRSEAQQLQTLYFAPAHHPALEGFDGFEMRGRQLTPRPCVSAPVAEAAALPAHGLRRTFAATVAANKSSDSDGFPPFNRFSAHRKLKQ